MPRRSPRACPGRRVSGEPGRERNYATVPDACRGCAQFAIELVRLGEGETTVSVDPAEAEAEWAKVMADAEESGATDRTLTEVGMYVVCGDRGAVGTTSRVRIEGSEQDGAITAWQRLGEVVMPFQCMYE